MPEPRRGGLVREAAADQAAEASSQRAAEPGGAIEIEVARVEELEEIREVEHFDFDFDSVPEFALGPDSGGARCCLDWAGHAGSTVLEFERLSVPRLRHRAHSTHTTVVSVLSFDSLAEIRRTVLASLSSSGRTGGTSLDFGLRRGRIPSASPPPLAASLIEWAS